MEDRTLHGLERSPRPVCREASGEGREAAVEETG